MIITKDYLKDKASAKSQTKFEEVNKAWQAQKFDELFPCGMEVARSILEFAEDKGFNLRAIIYNCLPQKVVNTFVNKLNTLFDNREYMIDFISDTKNIAINEALSLDDDKMVVSAETAFRIEYKEIMCDYRNAVNRLTIDTIISYFGGK